MELSELIGNTLNEISRARDNYESKSNYNIDEVNLEINVSEIEQTSGGVKIVVFNGGLNVTNSSTHKIHIKLKPKSKRTLNSNG
jgi:hypothetical protein